VVLIPRCAYAVYSRRVRSANRVVAVDAVLVREDYRWKRDGEAFKPDHKLVVYVNKNKGGTVGCPVLYFDGNRQGIYDFKSENGTDSTQVDLL
jgi:hypothetical protein